MDPSAKYCAGIVRRSGSTFRVAFRFLNAEQRRGMTAVYAFCRMIDDIVDSAFEPAAKTKQLEFWRAQVATCGTGCSHHPLTQELRWAIQTFGIPTTYLQELIDGVARDIAPTPVETRADLLRYCYGVAGTVGLMCLRLFRVEETPAVRQAAITLGNAFQLTNILRDLSEDLRLGRFYLPAEDCVRFGATPEMFAAPGLSVQAAQLIAFEASLAEEFFQGAWQGFTGTPQERLRPAWMMSCYYHELLRMIRRDPRRVLSTRVTIPWWKKIQLLMTPCPPHSSLVVASPASPRPLS